MVEIALWDASSFIGLNVCQKDYFINDIMK